MTLEELKYFYDRKAMMEKELNERAAIFEQDKNKLILAIAGVVNSMDKYVNDFNKEYPGVVEKAKQYEELKKQEESSKEVVKEVEEGNKEDNKEGNKEDNKEDNKEGKEIK